MTNYRISVDPGLSTGVAIWPEELWRKLSAPCRTHLLRTPSHVKLSSWEVRCEEQFKAFAGLLEDWKEVRTCYCELPVFFGSSGGMAVAGTDALVKLAYLVGGYAAICSEREIFFSPVPVPKWKGQLPKEVVNRRVLRLLGSKACSAFKADVWDAVGLGLYAKGFL